MPTKKRRNTKPPAYRKREGYTHAIVTLRDSATGRARDFWLGEYGTPESRELYHRLIAEWEARGRCWPLVPGDAPPAAGPAAMTIDELLVEYRRWGESYYCPEHINVLKMVFGVLRKYYGSTPAADFGPNKLRMLRDEMILGDASADRPRKPWSRKCVNAAVQRIRHLFKWAVARELIPAAVHQALATLEPLKRGRTAARETERVRPVSSALLCGSLRHMSRPVRALVRLQLLTGARAGELLAMRVCDIEVDPQSGVFYRFMPRDMDENDNGTMASVYNRIDALADRLGSCFVLIHHTTKGSQAGKSVTDVGAGAGSQSRATDTHVVLRPHEEPKAVVLDAAVRSWAPIEPVVLRWEFPVWRVASDLDPTALRVDKPRRRSDPEPAAPEVGTEWDAESFVKMFVTNRPQTRLTLLDAAASLGLSRRRAQELLHAAEARGLAHRWGGTGRKAAAFARVPEVQEDAG